MARQGTSEAETWLTRSNKVTVMAAPAARTQPSPSPTAVVTTNHSDGDDTGGDPYQHRLFFSWQRARNRAPFPLPICAPLPCSVRRQW
ncbi:hypothetical protein AHAS_Ahas11G0217000 [Arachis hypogaea]